LVKDRREEKLKDLSMSRTYKDGDIIVCYTDVHQVGGWASDNLIYSW